ncbi:MAG: acyl-CoA thioesterase [Bacteroidales bacterium]|nr:acyl-CoA thioesterase [Bacteroidales bacterium]
MIEHTTQLRVRYAETDTMGYVYYGNHPTYYEVARTELMRSLGSSYRKLEEEGIMMPVISLQIHYKQPAFYDDLLNIRTVIKALSPTRITFGYEIFNESGDLINVGETTLIFISSSSKKPVRAPSWFLDLLSEL